MNNRYKRLFEANDHEGEFWPSFTDMLAAILLVMLLLLTVYIDRVYADYMKQKEQAEEYRQQIEELQGVSQELIEKLITQFSDKGLDIEVDPKTGAIEFNSEFLFDYDSAKMSRSFKGQLQEIMPLYFSIIYSEEFRDHIAEVIVEGHTDDDGDYLYNLDLSQRRAHNVVSYILSEEFGTYENKNLVMKDITANGRSYSEPKYVGDTKEVDDDKSRRVEINYRLRNNLLDNE